MKISSISSGGKAHDISKQPEMFPATKLLLRTVEEAIYSGAFQGGSEAEQRLLELVSSAKHEMKAKRRHLAHLEAQNSDLEGECLRYKTSVCKIKTQSENLRRSSQGKNAVCDAQLQKLVVLLREVQGYEEDPEFSEDEQLQQEQQLAPLSSSGGVGDDGDSSDGNDASHLCSSNQSEEDQSGIQDDDVEAEHQGDSESIELLQRDAFILKHHPDDDDDDDDDRVSSKVSFSTSKSESVNDARLGLSLTVAEPMKKQIKEPKPPRGSTGSSSTGEGDRGARSSESRSRRSRLKFQFPEVELSAIGEDDFDEDNLDSCQTKSPSRFSCMQRRRFSSGAVLSAGVPLRRKSFTMKRSPGKRIAVSAAEDEPISAITSTPESLATSSRWASRRKSTTSACYPPPRTSSSASHNSSRSPAQWKLDQRRGSTQGLGARRGSASLAAPSPRSSQMVVRVRERKADGVPELVICKKPARFVVWQWNDRQVRIPFMIQLGPQQHAIMLRQLRYVKSVMHDLPWAKTHLKELLSAYTKKDLSKEQLYPQLNYLSHHVEAEIDAKANKQRLLTAKKHHLTLQLTLATGTVNELRMIKFGRRGKPHETRLCYDPSDPTRLHWLRKNGDKSDESLSVDEIEVRDSQLDSSVLKRAARKYPLDPNSCVTLFTAARSLDLQLKDPLHRDWLINALRDITSFARQYKAAGALGRRVQSQKNLLASGR